MRKQRNRNDTLLRLGRYWFDKPDPPAAPDYVGAAQQQGVANLEAARTNTRLGRPNEYTPIGSRTWIDQGNDQWQSNINLSPEMQGLFDQQNRISKYQGDVGEASLSRISDTFGTPFDVAGLPTVYTPNDARRSALADAMMARLDPRLAREEDALRTRLANQGIMQGSDAYGRELETINQKRNDAAIQADIAAGQQLAQQYGLEESARNRAVQEQAFLRNLPLAELNALRTGAQPQMPTFQAYGQGQTQAAPIFAATQAGYQGQLDAYNAQAAQQGNLMSGLFGLGSAAIGAFSDRRLKRQIRRIGALPSGLPVYRFRYVWGAPAVGVMADEAAALFPAAVSTGPGGYAVVNYAMIG